MKTIKKDGKYFIELSYNEYQAIKCLIFLYRNEEDFGLFEYRIKDSVFYIEIFEILGVKDESHILEIDKPVEIYKLLNLISEKNNDSIFIKYIENLKQEIEQNSLRRILSIKKLKENIKNGRNLEKIRKI